MHSYPISFIPPNSPNQFDISLSFPLAAKVSLSLSYHDEVFSARKIRCAYHIEDKMRFSRNNSEVSKKMRIILLTWITIVDMTPNWLLDYRSTLTNCRFCLFYIYLFNVLISSLRLYSFFFCSINDLCDSLK